MLRCHSRPGIAAALQAHSNHPIVRALFGDVPGAQPGQSIARIKGGFRNPRAQLGCSSLRLSRCSGANAPLSDTGYSGLG